MIYIGEVPPSSYSHTTFRELLHGCRILINAANAHIRNFYVLLLLVLLLLLLLSLLLLLLLLLSLSLLLLLLLLLLLYCIVLHFTVYTITSTILRLS